MEPAMMVEKTSAGGKPAGETPAPISSDQNTIDAAMSHQREMMVIAKQKGQVRKDGTMDPAWLERMARGDDINSSRARLCLTLQEMASIKSDPSDKSGDK
jgi:hypothetical protein